MPQEFNGGRAKQQELAGFLASTDAFVDDSAENVKEPGHAVYLVQNHELAAQTLQVSAGVVEPVEVRRAFEVEIDGGVAPTFLERLANGSCQRGLAHLARPNEYHRRKDPQVFAELRAEHSRKYLRHGL